MLHRSRVPPAAADDSAGSRPIRCPDGGGALPAARLRAMLDAVGRFLVDSAAVCGSRSPAPNPAASRIRFSRSWNGCPALCGRFAVATRIAIATYRSAAWYQMGEVHARS